MNKRQRKKAINKKRENYFRKMFDLFLDDKITGRQSLFSTWDEEYLPEPPPRFTPKLETK